MYPYRLVADHLGGSGRGWLLFLNPMVSIVLVFQRGIYNVIESGSGDSITPILPAGVGAGWYLWHLALVGAVSVVLLLGALRLFSRLEGNLAEEL